MNHPGDQHITCRVGSVIHMDYNQAPIEHVMKDNVIYISKDMLLKVLHLCENKQSCTVTGGKGVELLAVTPTCTFITHKGMLI